MTRHKMLAAYRELCVAERAVLQARDAVNLARDGYGCQLPTNTWHHLAQVHLWLTEELEALAYELTKEAS